jgi:tetratricopeptide (TPR) repeat protein
VLYLRLCFWPWPLILDYGPGHVGSLAGVLPYAAVVGVLGGLTIAGLRYRPACGLLGLWFFAILAPSSSVVPITSECAAEKRMYLPLAAVAVGVVLCVHAGGQRLWAGRGGRGGRVLGYGLAGLVVAALAVVSVRRNEDYRTELAIFQDTVDKRPGNVRACCNLGRALVDAGRVPEAIERLEDAIRRDPDFAQSHLNLGVALAKAGRLPEAIGCYQRALELRSDSPEAQNNLGNALARSGRASEAVGHYQQALRLKPDFADAYHNLGCALCELGRFDAAAASFEEALGWEPRDARTCHDLAGALTRLGRVREAIARYDQALQQDPGDVASAVNLAWLLATRPEGDVGQALSLAERACRETDGRSPECLDVLATAYASAGRYPEAVRAAERAVELASAAGRTALARQIEARLKLYRSRQP